MDSEERFLREAVALARANIGKGGRPFGAVVARGGEMIASGVNETYFSHDPTDHAEMTALRAASRALGSPDLSGCAVYASGQPCPMCLAAMRLAGVADVHYAYSNQDGAPYGLSTAALYEEMARPLEQQPIAIRYLPVRPEGAGDLYAGWKARQDQA